MERGGVRKRAQVVLEGCEVLKLRHTGHHLQSREGEGEMSGNERHDGLMGRWGREEEGM